MAGPLSLQDWIAFNEEVAALVRAGIPLDQGLTAVGSGLRGRLGKELSAAGERISNGESVVDAIAYSAPGLPASYVAAIEAGNASGNLASALSTFATAARNMRDLRQEVGNALVYPMIVIGMAYLWLILLLRFLLEQYVGDRSEWLSNNPWLKESLIGMRASMIYWAPIPPILFFILLANWFWTGRHRGADSRSAAWVFGWLPTVRKLLTLLRQARFADLLAMMVEQGVPLHRSFVLAAESTGEPKFIASCREVSRRLAAGERVSPSMLEQTGLPGILRWAILSELSQERIAHGLRAASDSLKRQVQSRAAFVGQLLPGVILLSVGGITVTAYCLTVFLPFTAALRMMAGVQGGG